MALVSITRVPEQPLFPGPGCGQAAGDPHLLFPQGDVGREGQQGVPGEAGRRVNGTAVPMEGDGRLMLGGLAEGSQFAGGSASPEGEQGGCKGISLEPLTGLNCP